MASNRYYRQTCGPRSIVVVVSSHTCRVWGLANANRNMQWNLWQSFDYLLCLSGIRWSLTSPSVSYLFRSLDRAFHASTVCFLEIHRGGLGCLFIVCLETTIRLASHRPQYAIIYYYYLIYKHNLEVRLVCVLTSHDYVRLGLAIMLLGGESTSHEHQNEVRTALRTKGWGYFANEWKKHQSFSNNWLEARGWNEHFAIVGFSHLAGQ